VRPRRVPPKAINWTILLLGFAGMVIGQFMAILDIQIVASSLPQIQAGVGASADEISWIQTAYLIPEVVMIPLSGYLSRLWGTQRLFLISCTGFMLMSVATGLSNSIDTMIFFRALQGFVGGAMIPTVFAVAFTAFPPDKRVTASVVMGLIVTLAPTVGPTLGGHLTEWLSWRWLFFINVIPGMLVLFLVSRYANFDKGDPSLAKGFDWFGLGLMATFLMSMQYRARGRLQERLAERQSDPGAVDHGGDRRSGLRLALPDLSQSDRGAARLHQPQLHGRGRHDLHRRLRPCSAGPSCCRCSWAGCVTTRPSEVGTTMVVSGLAMFATGPFAGRLVRALDPRILMFGGFMLCAWGMWDARLVTDDWGFWQFASVQALRGVGVMIAMIASQQVTMSTLPPHMVKNASGLVNLFRNVGGAFGLAFLNTSLTTNTAAHMSELTTRISQTNLQMQDMMAGIADRFSTPSIRTGRR
jgi:DHA2 family multidrug resistance protein